MRTTLKYVFKDTMESLKRYMKNRDQWIMQWPGQLCITASQVRIVFTRNYVLLRN